MACLIMAACMGLKTNRKQKPTRIFSASFPHGITG